MVETDGVPVHAGVARATITPPVGATLVGYFARKGGSTSERDPLYATALVLDDGQHRVALLSCDLLGVHASLVDEVRASVHETTGIAPDHVMICCTHTHSGPPGYLHPNARAVDRAYVANLRFALAGAVTAATRNLQPVRLRWGTSESDIGINRREVRPDGRVVLGHNPAGPVDRAVRVARFDRQDGRPLAILVNYACHPVVFGSDNMAISADYVGHTRTIVEHATGAAMLFVQGACGDINPRQRATPGGRQAEMLGVELAGAVLTAHATATPISTAGLAATTTRLDLPLLRDTSSIPDLISEQERGSLHPIIDQRMPGAATVSTDPATGELTTPIELHVLRLGDLAIVGIPAEPFVEIGLALQAGRPGQPTMVAGYTNGCVGYVPMPAAYPLGGYEVSYSFAYYRLPAPLAPECAQRIIDEGRRLLDVLPG